MYKNITAIVRDRRRLFTCLFMMKLYSFLLLGLFLQASGNTYAQKISLSVKGAELADVLDKIQKQTNLDFLYNSSQLKHVEKIDLHVKDLDLKKVLDACLTPRGLYYVVQNKTVLIKRISDLEHHGSENIALQRQVKGKVRNAEGLPLAGISVRLIQSNITVVSQNDGSFTIPVVQDEGQLLITALGYEEQRINYRIGSELIIYLQAKASDLDEVVVVGYGTQRKVNLTGAVGQASGKIFEDKPVANVAQALQGAVPNLNIVIGDGHPGSTGTFNVRGFASVNNVNGSPLVLVDGAPGDINMINPNDIASISVLKDAASSAIYGARAAFGVILITTKESKNGKFNINYGTSYGLQKVTTRTDFLTDPYDQMKLVDEAFSRNTGSSYSGYTEADYEELKKRQTDKTLPDVVIQNRNGVDQYVYYGNTDWWHWLYRDVTPQMEHYMSLSGGTDKASILLSGRYFHQDGLYQSNLHNDKYNSYNFRAKIEVRPNDHIRLYSNTQISANSYRWPGDGMNGNNSGLYYHAMAAYVPYNPDGTLRYRTNLNRYAAYEYPDLAYGKSHGSTRNYNVSSLLGINYKITNQVELNGYYSYEMTPSSYDLRTTAFPWSVVPGVIQYQGNDVYTDKTYFNQHHSVNFYATYDNIIRHRDHHLKAMAGFNAELQKYKTNSATAYDLLSLDLNQIDLGTGSVSANGNANEWALLGYFGRINYDFKNKLLFEVNGRYDGTSRFPKENRFGFFPSVSAGWRIGEESFWKGIKKLVPELKLRGSYGLLGNQDLGNGSANFYPYIPVMNNGLSKWVASGSQVMYMSAPNPVTPDFTWEKTKSTNIGVDVSLFSPNLQISFDKYRRLTTEMLINGKTLPSVFGAGSPKQNAGNLQTDGFELSIGWKEQFTLAQQPFAYNVGFVLSDYTAKITKFDNPNKLLNNYYEGQKLGEIWGYKTDGFFKTDEEAASWPINQDYIDQSQRLTSPGTWHDLHAGDMKFKDLNGDKRIDIGDNTLANHGDLSVIGNSLPRYSYGFNAGFSWNQIDFSMTIQGIMRQNWYPDTEAGMFWGVYGRPYSSFIPKDILSKVWSPENPDAYFPLVRGYEVYPGGALSTPNDKYLQNIGYMRLKNLTIGYDLNPKLLKIKKINRLRLYFSGQNILTFTSLKSKYIDPESVGAYTTDRSGRAYPFMKNYTFGIDVNF